MTATALNADGIRATAMNHIENIREDKTLTPEYKRQLIAGVYVKAKAELNEVKDKAQKAPLDRIQSLRSTLFGLSAHADPTAVISYRDAQDRAARLDPHDEATALRLLNQATTSGDTTLAKAIATTAIDNGWADVANTYSSRDPYTEKHVDELWELTHTQGPSNDLTNAIQTEMKYSFPAPHELGGLSDIALNEVADGSDGQ